MTKKYLVTSALPYANGPLHLGHLAGAYLPADVYVRYLRLSGKDVLWVCGSDEHGAAITIRAKKEGISPREIIDKYHNLNKNTFQQLGIAFDYYHRTSEALHHETSQDFFLRLYEKGDEFEEQLIEQYYDEAYDQFLADRYIIGTCPRCGHEEAYGDQCENCGSDLSPLELINPKSTLSGKAPILKTTKHWYFKLDKHEKWLREWIEKGILDGKQHHDPKTWRKHVVGQCLSWLDNGLQPRSITRDLDWGIPVPLEEGKGKVLYVWFDAPIGYISSARQWALENGQDWESYWKGEDVELIHFIGKDNIVFHCVIFPAMLKAYGDFNLPVNVPANQFLNFEGQKFSKSRGWGIEQHEYLEAFRDFPNKEDALRYALIRNSPENKDADFKWDEFVDFHDKELADNLGNFVNRVVVLTNNYLQGKVPDSNLDLEEVLNPVFALLLRWQEEMEAFSAKSAAQTFMEISSWGNTYLQDAAPWALYKVDPSDPRIKDCLFVCLQITTLLSLLCEPFIPFTAPKVRQLLGLSPSKCGDLEQSIDSFREGMPLLNAGHQIGQPAILFAKINDRKDDSRLQIVNRQKEKLQAILEGEKQKEREPMKAPIEFDDFSKLDLRTGTIIEAEKVAKAKKLLKLRIDLGIEQRTVVSGIAEYFEPESVVGQQVVLVANLAPRELRGILSEGMILMAENEKGELGFVSPQPGWGNGFVVR
ncbi:MAG TPA: methionine--tRNA ligase [Saprospiraceae bacterium]|nr:methionine--tRNA ligase [Saprospiraceae bacterium]HMQ81476.1 methionine--tRNA ligase [Saprospiraceae bacterium]